MSKLTDFYPLITGVNTARKMLDAIIFLDCKSYEVFCERVRTGNFSSDKVNALLSKDADKVRKWYDNQLKYLDKHFWPADWCGDFGGCFDKISLEFLRNFKAQNGKIYKTMSQKIWGDNLKPVNFWDKAKKLKYSVKSLDFAYYFSYYQQCRMNKWDDVASKMGVSSTALFDVAVSALANVFSAGQLSINTDLNSLVRPKAGSAKTLTDKQQVLLTNYVCVLYDWLNSPYATLSMFEQQSKVFPSLNEELTRLFFSCCVTLYNSTNFQNFIEKTDDAKYKANGRSDLKKAAMWLFAQGMDGRRLYHFTPMYHLNDYKVYRYALLKGLVFSDEKKKDSVSSSASGKSVSVSAKSSGVGAVQTAGLSLWQKLLLISCAGGLLFSAFKEES